MKKIKFILYFILLYFVPFTVFAISYNDVQSAVKEVMKDYYIKSKYTQYDNARAGSTSTVYEFKSPEEATRQDTQYFVCANFTYNVLYETFGMKNTSVNNVPRWASEITNTAKDCYNNLEKRNSNYLLLYQTKDKSVNYVHNNLKKVNDFVSFLKPGDLLAYTGHTMIVYDVAINPKTNQLDALILNSNSSHAINSPFNNSTYKLYYYNEPSSSKNNVVDIDKEGSIRYFWLSEKKEFVNEEGNLVCNKNECAIIRIFYDNSGIASFNYNINNSSINNALVRKRLPSISIEKVVSIGDNIAAYQGQTMTYKILIRNNTDLSYDNTNYGKFFVEETISENVTYIDSNNGGQYSNGTILWQIPQLAAGEEISLEFSVTVNENSTNSIISNGKVFIDSKENYIKTGKTENKVYRNFSGTKNSYSSCYDNNKNEYSGLELIDKIYECAIDKQLNLKSSFEFEDLIYKKELPTSIVEPNTVTLNTNNLYYPMVFNNYWSGTITYLLSNVKTLSIGSWKGEQSEARNRIINKSDFKPGDILIYQSVNEPYDENGLYAYIYIGDKFVGVNYNGSENERNSFDYKYFTDKYTDSQLNSNFYTCYNNSSCTINAKGNSELLEYLNYQTLFGKDYYVILRPSLVSLNPYVNILTFIKEGNIIKDIPVNSNSSFVLSKISTSGSMKLLDKNNKELTNSIVKTGDKVMITFDNKDPEEYILSVKGDNTGDGLVNINDIITIVNKIKSNGKIEGAYKASSDVNNDGTINILDITKIVSHIINGVEL